MSIVGKNLTMVKLSPDEISILKKVETLIREYRTSIDARTFDRQLGLAVLDVFLTEQRIARNTCDDILKKLKGLA